MGIIKFLRNTHFDGNPRIDLAELSPDSEAPFVIHMLYSDEWRTMDEILEEITRYCGQNIEDFDGFTPDGFIPLLLDALSILVQEDYAIAKIFE